MFRRNLQRVLSDTSPRSSLALAVLFLVAPTLAADTPRFQWVDGLTVGDVTWVSVDEQRVAFGSGSSVWVADTMPQLEVQLELQLEEPIHHAVLAGNHLYLSAPDGLEVLNLVRPEAPTMAVELSPRPRGALHLARMDDYLLVAENGRGVRILTLPPPPGHKSKHHHHEPPLRQVGLLSLREAFLGVTASVRRIYVAVEGGGLTVAGALDPRQPQILSEYSLEHAITAIAANGPRVHTLGPQGLRILNLGGQPGAEIEGSDASIRGAAIELGGRVAYVARPGVGLAVLQDTAVGSTTHFVTVSDNVFTPASLIVELGDTVEWNSIEGFHNVESCDGNADPAECLGQVSVEGTWGSGPPAPDPWTFSKTFNVTGNNPYFCIVHVDDNMVGSVTVQAPPVADHFVAASGFVFAPANLIVSPGDVVQWDNVAGFHNVESCDGVSDPALCAAQIAVEGSFFLPGGPTALPWTFQHTFTPVGDNPYFCIVHAAVGMGGNVTTVAALGPPGVPDGTNGAPMLVSKLDPLGSMLSLSWDAASCAGAMDHQVIFAGGSDLPSALGGVYSATGGVCAIGNPPFNWTAVPDPATIDPVTRLLWFLMLATDGGTAEGSWGVDSGLNERSGPGPGGASNQCVPSKDLSNTCP